MQNEDRPANYSVLIESHGPISRKINHHVSVKTKKHLIISFTGSGKLIILPCNGRAQNVNPTWYGDANQTVTC